MSIKEIVATAANTVRQATASVTGDPALIARLKGEHTEVATLMKSILAKKDSVDFADLKERHRVFEVIREKLTAHSTAEEQVVYPNFEKADGPALEADVEHSFDDHQRIEALLEQLHAMDVGEIRWMPLFEELETLVTAHVAEEENVVFPRAKESVSADEFKRLDAQFREVEEQVLANVDREGITTSMR